METTEIKKPAKKTAAKKAPAKKKEAATEVAENPVLVGGSYIYALGRRKTAIAKVYLIKNGKGTITVNGKRLKTGGLVVEPDLGVILEDVRTRGDRQHPFWASIEP